MTSAYFTGTSIIACGIPKDDVYETLLKRGWKPAADPTSSVLGSFARDICIESAGNIAKYGLSASSPNSETISPGRGGIRKTPRRSCFRPATSSLARSGTRPASSKSSGTFTATFIARRDDHRAQTSAQTGPAIENDLQSGPFFFNVRGGVYKPGRSIPAVISHGKKHGA